MIASSAETTEMLVDLLSRGMAKPQAMFRTRSPSGKQTWVKLLLPVRLPDGVRSDPMGNHVRSQSFIGPKIPIQRSTGALKARVWRWWAGAAQREKHRQDVAEWRRKAKATSERHIKTELRKYELAI